MFFEFIVFLCSLFLLNPSVAKEYNLIQVCSEAGFFPFEMRTNNGEWHGYDIALAKMFAKDTNRKIEFNSINFDGLIPALLSNKGCDIVVSAVGINPEREKIVLFSEPVYESAYAGLIRKEDAGKFQKYENINKKGVRIAVEQGTEASSYVQNNFPNATILNYQDNSVPINAVITNKVDMYIDDSVYVSIAVKRKISNLSMVPTNTFPENRYAGMGFLFRKSDVELRDEFNRYFDKIKKNGELDKLQHYYFDDLGWIKKFP